MSMLTGNSGGYSSSCDLSNPNNGALPTYVVNCRNGRGQMVVNNFNLGKPASPHISSARCSNLHRRQHPQWQRHSGVQHLGFIKLYYKCRNIQAASVLYFEELPILDLENKWHPTK